MYIKLSPFSLILSLQYYVMHFQKQVLVYSTALYVILSMLLLILVYLVDASQPILLLLTDICIYIYAFMNTCLNQQVMNNNG